MATKTPLYLFQFILFAQISGSFLLAANILAITKISNVLTEIPFGIISDRYLGRKGTYICG